MGIPKLRWKRAIVLVPALTGLFILSAGEKSRGAIAEALRDPLSVLAQRSPGIRGAGAMFQTKPDRVNSLAQRPHSGPTERVLSSIRKRPLISPPGDVSELLEPLATNEPVVSFLEGDDSGLESGPDILAANDVGGPIVAGSGDRTPDTGNPVLIGGPGPISLPEQPESPVPSTDVPAVPEPSTWLTMLIGFFAVGTAIRRGNRRTLKRPDHNFRSRQGLGMR